MRKSIVNTVSTKFFSAVFSFLIILVTSNFLGTQGRGEISLIIASISIILLFANFVGGNTLVYLTPRKPILELLLISYFWSILSALLALALLFLLAVFDFTTCFHISLLSLFFSFSSIHISILLGKEQIETANKIGLFQVVAHFFLLSFCFIFLESKNTFVFIYSLYITYGITLLVSAFLLKKYLTFERGLKLSVTLRMAFALGAVAQLANIFQFLNYRLDVYLLNKFDSLSNLGIYSTSVAIAEAVLLFGGSFALVQFAKISNTESNSDSKDLTIKLTRFSILLTLIAYLPLFIFPDEFYNFLLGKDFHHVRTILYALAPGIIALGSSITLSHYFAGIGQYKINALASFVGLFLTLLLGVIFIPKYGFMAAAWISSASYFVSTLVLVVAFTRKTKSTFVQLLPTISDLKFLQKSLVNVRNNRNR